VENQLNILSESLDEKIQILGQIQRLNRQQSEAFSKETADLDEFDKAFDEKDKLIDSLTRLDDGFEALYDRVAEELKENRMQYAAQIKSLQEKIAKITELSASIQAQEARNKRLMESYFAQTRSGLKQNRQTSKAAYDYYRNMSGVAYSASRFMDNKQ